MELEAGWLPQIGQVVRIRNEAQRGSVMLVRTVDEVIYVDVEIRETARALKIEDLLRQG